MEPRTKRRRRREPEEEGLDLPPEVWYEVVLLLRDAELVEMRNCSRMFRGLVDRALRTTRKEAAERIRCVHCGGVYVRLAGATAIRCVGVLDSLAMQHRAFIRTCMRVDEMFGTAVDYEALDVMKVLWVRGHMTWSMLWDVVRAAEERGRLRILEWCFGTAHLATSHIMTSAGIGAVDSQRLDVLEWYKGVWPEFVAVNGAALYSYADRQNRIWAMAWLVSNGVSPETPDQGDAMRDARMRGLAVIRTSLAARAASRRAPQLSVTNEAPE